MQLAYGNNYPVQKVYKMLIFIESSGLLYVSFVTSDSMLAGNKCLSATRSDMGEKLFYCFAKTEEIFRIFAHPR